jgi:hypothetical protein
VAENAFSRSGWIIMNCLPEGVGCDFFGLAVFGHHVDDAETDGAKLVKEFRSSRDDRAAAFGR